MKVYALLENDQGEIVAVGPFPDHDDATDWADDAEAAGWGTVRGNVRAVSRTEFKRSEVSTR